MVKYSKNTTNITNKTKEFNGVQCLFLELSTKNFHKGLKFLILSSYYRDVFRVVSRISKTSWIDSLEIENSLPLNQQLMWSPSTMAFAKNSRMIFSNISPTELSNFVHVLSLNTSEMKVPSRDSKIHNPL